jgi:hypothetical protein
MASDGIEFLAVREGTAQASGISWERVRFERIESAHDVDADNPDVSDALARLATGASKHETIRVSGSDTIFSMRATPDPGIALPWSLAELASWEGALRAAIEHTLIVCEECRANPALTDEQTWNLAICEDREPPIYDEQGAIVALRRDDGWMFFNPVDPRSLCPDHAWPTLVTFEAR